MKYLLVIFAIAMTFACTKKPETGSSVIQFRMPTVPGQQMKEGVSVLSTIPSDRKACFGVNVFAPDMPGTPASTCSPRTGVTRGFVGSGETLSIDVLKGDARTFELYLYLMASGDTGPCPGFGARFSQAELKNVYFLDSVTVPIRQAVEEVTLTAYFPGVDQSLNVRNGYPQTCLATVTGGDKIGFKISNAMGTASGGTTVLKARVGQIKGPVMTGTTTKLIVK